MEQNFSTSAGDESKSTQVPDPYHYRIVLAGNPNSGKTTLFNKITGLRYKVGNYPGVTVEKKSAKLVIENKIISLVDLPGIYSLGSFSEDELIATESLFGSLDTDPPPDVIIAVADSSNLERNLFFITQLIDLGFPVVLALTMNDLAETKGIQVHSELLSQNLDIPVVLVQASQNKGVSELKKTVISLLQHKKLSSKRFVWCNSELYRSCIRTIGERVKAYQTFLASELTDSMGMVLFSDAYTPKTEAVKEVVSQQKKIFRDAGFDPDSYEPSERYRFVNTVYKNSTHVKSVKNSFATKLDAFLVHKVFGLLVFLTIMVVMFQSIFLWAQAPMEYIEFAVGWISSLVDPLLPEGLLKSLLLDGIIAGVGNIIIFIPQIAILFFLLGVLDDSGYLGRAAFVMDRVMRPLGLQGRAFIPLLSSFACAIPGIMSTRTIASRTDRLATILIAPLMSCSARLPVYTVLIAAFINRESRTFGLSTQGLSLLGLYVLGVIAAGFVSFILRKTILKGDPSLFLMEMPQLRVPAVTTVLRDVYDRVQSFIKNAGTMILACSVVLWFLASFPRTEGMSDHDIVQNSYAAMLGKTIEPVISPLGYNWEIGVGLIASFAAREVFVTTLATIYNLDSEDQSPSLISALKQKERTGEFSRASAVSLLVFYAFACQCMSTLAICKRETGSWFWVFLMFSYMTILAYCSAFFAYRIAQYIV